MEYTIDTSGDFKVTIPLDDRQQQVWIYSQAHGQGNELYRELISPAYSIQSDPNPVLYRQLLEDNYSNSLWGNWGLVRQDGEELVVFIIKIPQADFQQRLPQAIYRVAQRADSLENSLSSMDQF